MTVDRENGPLVRSLLKSIRAYQRHKSRPGWRPRLLRRIARVERNVLSVLTASDISVGTRLGRGLRLPHPTGVVMHQDATIGEDCMIMQQVTIGQLAGGGAPTIGSRVYIGAGAKVLGRITIGDGARIGANAVVLDDVPAGATAVGMPARVVRNAPRSPEPPPTEAP